MPLSGPHPIVVRVSRVLEPIFFQFLAIQQAKLAELDRALADGDATTLIRLAHSLKGTAATYELPEAAALGACLEDAVANSRQAEAAPLVAAIRRYFEALQVVFVDREQLNIPPEHHKHPP